MHDNRHARSPVITTTSLYGMCMAHIFIRVCTLIYNGGSPSTFARHLSHQYLPQMAPPPRCSRHQARGVLHGPDHSGRVACGRNNCIDQRQPQSTVGCPNGHVGPTRPSSNRRNTAREFGARRFMSQCSVQVNSAARPCCAGCANETTSGRRSVVAWAWGPIGVHNSGDDALLQVVTPLYTTGVMKGRSRSH